MNTPNPSAKRDALKEKILDQWTSDQSHKKTVVIFLSLAIFFTAIGIMLAVYMNQAKEFIYKYSEYSQCINTPNCTISLFIEERLEGPVFFWYQLGSFYQNHKQYIKSSKIQDTDQEIGEFPEACFPFFTNKEAGRNISITNISLSPDDSVIPCGIAANTFFNDTFTMKTIQGTDVFLNSTGISYESRHGYTIPNIDLSKQWINMENEHFLNWLRLAGMGTFRKLWARIDQDIEPGEYTITIINNFNVTSYEASKSIVIGTVSEMGGQNMLLTVCYLVAAILSWLIVTIFTLIIIRNKKKYQ